MKEVEKLAAFIVDAQFDDISIDSVLALKIRVLDSIGCAIGALKSPVIALLKAQIDDFGGAPLCTLIGNGKSAPDRTALFNTALVRYLDFNDSFLAKKETCHPSDNLGSVLAASEYAQSSGKEFLLALALAYQIQCRLSQEAPVRDKGFDHTTQGAYAVAAGVSKALKLNQDQTASAIAMAGVANNALRVTRTGALSHWKGLAYPNTAFSATHAAFLAYRNITGPLEIFEGNKGFKHSIAGEFQIDWQAENLEMVRKTIIKKYNAEIHSQTTLEGILDLRAAYSIPIAEIKDIQIEIFDVAFNIIGGGEEGGKKEIHTKEEADHSLPYMVAAALIDGEVSPRQYEPSRIQQPDVQNLMQKITIKPSVEYSQLFPKEMPSKIRIDMNDGKFFEIVKRNYEGFLTRPMSWENVAAKFNGLAAPFVDEQLRHSIIDTIARLENVPISELIACLAKISFKEAT